MRVSIVATSLDGQQPEPKSVINMVHRIQNRNPGYSDFSNTGSTQSFTFSSPNNSIITNGANALKIEDEVKSESQESSHMSEVEETNNSSNIIQETENQSEIVNSDNEILDEKKEETNETSTSNGLENFEFHEEETPELFNSSGEHNEKNENSFLSSEISDKEEEDELEIPAFLRRQKN